MSDEQVVAPETTDGGAVDTGGVEESTGGAIESDLFGDGKPFTWKEGDKEFTFSKRRELADFLSSRTGQSRAERERLQEQAKYYEKRKQEQDTRETTLNESYAKIAQMDRFLKENPHVAERIAKEMQGNSGSPDLDKLLAEKMKPYEEKLNKYEEAEKARIASERRQKALNRMKESYPDFDESLAIGELNRLQEVPEEDQEYALYELLHYAMAGKLTPAQVEQKIAQEAGKKRAPSVTSTAGRGKQEPDVANMTRAEQQKYAYEIASQFE